MKGRAIIFSTIMASRTVYHWTYTPKRKNKKPHLILHKGGDQKCRRRHYDQYGNSE